MAPPLLITGTYILSVIKMYHAIHDEDLNHNHTTEQLRPTDNCIIIRDMQHSFAQRLLYDCMLVKSVFDYCVCVTYSLGAIADLDLAIRSKNIEDDVMVVWPIQQTALSLSLSLSLSLYLSQYC